MLLRLAGKLVWGTTKLTVKYVIVPIAITAAVATLMDEASDRLRDGKDKKGGKKVAVIEPQP